MSLLDSVIKGKQKPPVLGIVFGSAGVGKSTFASNAPSPIFLGTENGTAFLDVARLPAPKNFAEVLAGIKALTNDPHEYKSLVVDSLDWLEPLVWQRVVDDQNSDKVRTIEDLGYGKGYVNALNYWTQMITALTVLREKRKMNIILIAHSHVKKIEDPKTKSAYDRYVMKLHEKASALWREYVDVMCFATFEVFTTKEKDGKTRAYGGEERVLHTVYSAAYDAKNRMGLPEQLPVDWDAFIEAYNAGCGENLETIRREISVLIDLVDSKVRPQVDQAILNAGDSVETLSKVLTRLRKITCEDQSKGN